MTFALRILGHVYRIVAEDERVGQALRDITSGFAALDSGEGKTIRVSEEGLVSGFAAESKCYDSAADTLAGVEHDLYRHALDHCADIALHAAAVQKEERTVLLAGASGAGKTTLTLGLLRKGWILLSDEVAPLSTGTGTVRPFLRCPGASAATLRLLAWPTEQTEHVYLRNTFCLLPSALRVAAEKPHTISGVFFVERAETASLLPMDNAGGITRLLQLMTGQTDRKTAFETASKVAESASFYTLRNGELSQTIDLVENLL